MPEDQREAFWTVVRDNIATRTEMAGWWQLMTEGAAPEIPEEDIDFINEAMGLLPDGPWTAETWGDWTGAVKAATGRKGGALFKPLRLAMTGRTNGPGMGDLMPLMQKRPRL